MRFRSAVALAAASMLAACSSIPANQAATPQANESDGRLLRVGESVTGSIEASDPTWGGNRRFDAYRFQASEGDRVLILLDSEDFDPYLVVGTESGGIFDPLEQNDDAGSELNSRIRFTVPRTGTYRILAQAYDEYGLGTYQLSLQPYVPPAVETSPLAVGMPVDAYLDDEDNYDEDDESHYDEYTFQAQAGRSYSITMTSEDFDAYLFLGTGSGVDFEEIARNDDSGAGYDSRIRFAPDETGTYTVRATSYGASAGAYTIQVAEAAAPGPMVVTPLSLGRTVNGVLEDGDQIADDGSFFDAYTFTGRQGDRVEIVMRSTELDSYIEVGEAATSADDFFAEYSDDDSGGNLDSSIRITLPRDGEYHVRAMSLYPEESGSYTITLAEPGAGGDAPVRPQDIRFGQTVNGVLDQNAPILDDGSYYHLFTFDGRAGQRIRVTLSSDDFDSFIQFGPWSGSDIDVTDYDDDSGEGVSGLDSMLHVTLPRTGTYAIMVNTVYAEETGAYTVTLEEQ